MDNQNNQNNQNNQSENTPTSDFSSSNNSNNQKPFLIWAVAILAVLILVGGLFYFWQNSNQGTNQQKVVVRQKEMAQKNGQKNNQNSKQGINQQKKKTDQNNISKTKAINSTANWKTYRNEKYGYEVKYPSFYNKVNEYYKGKHVSIGGSLVVYFNILVKKNVSSSEELKSWMKKLVKMEALKNSKITWENVSISGKKAIKAKYKIFFVNGRTGAGCQVGVVNSTNAYVLMFVNGSAKYCNQIISTFKFTSGKN